MIIMPFGRELTKQKRHSPPLRPMLVMPVGLQAVGQLALPTMVVKVVGAVGYSNM